MKLKFAAAIAAACIIAAGAASADDAADRAAEAKTVIKGFFGNLKGTLEAAMKEGGPVNAIDVCKTKAGPIAMQASSDSGWRVGRTSLKVRNPSNKPDAWERNVLQMFEEKKAGGADPATLEHGEVVQEGGKQRYRFMKAIPTAEVCLNCHGGAIKDEVKGKLAELYPLDKATGFAVGDLRGAFTLSKDLP
jgi:hypothetical protein